MILASQSSLLIVYHLAEDQQTKLVKLSGQAVLISLQSMLCPDVWVQKQGALAQLGERLICIQEVRSSILLGSTTIASSPFYSGSVAQVVRAHA